MEMSFLDLVKKSRSWRGYDETRAISKEELLSLIEPVRYCPSTVNLQPLRYCLIWEKEKVEAFLPLTLWAKALKDIKLPHDGKHPTAFVVICQDLDRGPNPTRFIRDVGIVAQTILLGATEKGLGGIMIGSFRAEEVSKHLGLPDTIVPMLVLAIGKPDEDVILEDCVDGKLGYYRDENDAHHVPKRPLCDLIVEVD